jgi:phosphomannomutase
VTASLVEQARAWRDGDLDERTRAELTAVLDAAASPDDAVRRAALADLADRFAGPLRFGTAGLRGRMGAGPNRMNRVVVVRAAAGLADYVRANGGSSLVVGHDARAGSAAFAHDTCAVATAAGLRTWLLPGPLPTPVLAFAIRHLGADAGVMVTASHNPAPDNGYKVYLGDGRQIVQPVDADIAARIERISQQPPAAVPRAAGGWTVLDEGIVDAYLARAAGVVADSSPRAIDVVYTPLHGVGGVVLDAALRRAGFAAPIVVPTQAEPDPTFPTVPFPNPEEPGATDLALSLARERGADLVLANDPDADRCAVGARVGGLWRMLTGDEVGGLLGEHLAGRHHVSGTFASTVVSSSLLARIAAAHGLPFVTTLTGFKWIGRAPGLRYGYEEALGYCCDPDAVADKDGISAALLVAELAATLRVEGRGLGDALDDLARRYGLHATRPVTLRVADLAVAEAVLGRLRAHPPAALGGLAVTSTDDLATGVDGLPPTDGVRFRLASGARVVVRPSGTEPKLKGYLEVVVPVAPDARDAELAAARRAADERLTAIARDLAAAGGF